MANHYYVENYDVLTNKERIKLRRRFVCAECGGFLTYWITRPNGLDEARVVYLACHRQNFNQHEGVARESVTRTKD